MNVKDLETICEQLSGKVEIMERCDENKPNKLSRLSGALLEASARETSLQSKLDDLTGKPAATAPSPEESATKKELGHVLQRTEEMNEVTINLQMELDNYLSKLRNDLDEPHNRNQELRNQNEKLNMNVKDLENKTNE